MKGKLAIPKQHVGSILAFGRVWLKATKLNNPRGGSADTLSINDLGFARSQSKEPYSCKVFIKRLLGGACSLAGVRFKGFGTSAH